MAPGLYREQTFHVANDKSLVLVLCRVWYPWFPSFRGSLCFLTVLILQGGLSASQTPNLQPGGPGHLLGFSSPRLAVFTTTLEPGLPLPNMRCLFHLFCLWDSCLLFRLHDRWASSSPQLIRGCLFGKALFTPVLYFYRNIPYQLLGCTVLGLRPPSCCLLQSWV